MTVRALRDRNAEVFHLYSGMNTTMDDVLADYSEGDLELLVDFLQRTTTAGQSATASVPTSTTPFMKSLCWTQTYWKRPGMLNTCVYEVPAGFTPSSMDLHESG